MVSGSVGARPAHRSYVPLQLVSGLVMTRGRVAAILRDNQSRGGDLVDGVSNPGLLRIVNRVLKADGAVRMRYK